jgi:hypothetical protein
MYYKILKTGFYGEPYLNEVGKIVDLAPEVAEKAVREGYLEEWKNEPPKPTVPKAEKKIKRGKK